MFSRQHHYVLGRGPFLEVRKVGRGEIHQRLREGELNPLAYLDGVGQSLPGPEHQGAPFDLDLV